MTTSIERVNGSDMQPQIDLVAAARAEAIRREAETRAEAELIAARAAADAERVRAEADAEAARIKAAEEAERQRLANEKARMRLEKEQAAHEADLARKRKEKEQHEREARRAAEQEAAEKAAVEGESAELERTERLWKWGARGIYLVGLVIAAPVQFLAFWDPARPFLVAAPALLEGLALVLAAGAAWAVANRRDVLPYRVGIMLGALVAAGINLWHGLEDEAIGLNAGLIGALASLGGPIVLMAYEHGMTQRADGIPSWREKRAEVRARAEREAAHAARKQAAEEEQRRRDEAEEQRRRDEAEEQRRRDADREKEHPEVWRVADSMRSARGERVVTEAIWSEAWWRKTGSKVVGVTPEFEAESRAAQARMAAVANGIFAGVVAQVDSQKEPRAKKAPGAPDGRRNNGGVPPRRVPGDTPAYSPAAKKQASLEQVARKEQRQ